MRQIPFIHQLCSHPMLRSISIYIQHCSSYFFHVVFTLCLETLYICYLRMRSSKPLISRFSAIFKSFCPLCGTYWYEIQRDTVVKTQHRCIAICRWRSQRANFASLRNETVSHTKLIAPYHPRSNSQAERFVQTLKQFSGAEGKNSIRRTLARVTVLYSYTTTPNNTTGQTPAELILNRRLNAFQMLERSNSKTFSKETRSR